MFNDLWVEKYRPKNLDEIFLHQGIKEYFDTLESKESIPNLLFVGNPGIGKTTLAKIIVLSLIHI